MKLKYFYTIFIIVCFGLSCETQEKYNSIPLESNLTLYWISLKNAVNYENYSLLNSLIYSPVCIYNYQTDRFLEYDRSYLYSIMDALKSSAKDFINSYNPKITTPQSLTEIDCKCIRNPDTTGEFYIYKFKYNDKDNYLIFRLEETSFYLQYAKLDFNQSKINEEIEYEKKLRFFDYYSEFKNLLSNGVKERIADRILFKDFYINGTKMNRYLFHKNYSKEYPIVPKSQFGNSLQDFLNVDNNNIHISKNGENGINLDAYENGIRIIYIDINVKNTNKIRRYFFVTFDDEYIMVNTELIS